MRFRVCGKRALALTGNTSTSKLEATATAIVDATMLAGNTAHASALRRQSAMRGKDARGGDLVTAEQREGAALARSTSTQPGVREGRQGRVLLRRRSTNALGIPWKEGRGE